MEIFLLRHGKTVGNQHGRYNGRTDDPLCEDGFLQAETAGVLHNVSRVFVSPMKRARQTAEICFPNAEQMVIDDLREMNFGDFEGRTADEMENDMDYRNWVDGNCEGECPNGESIGLFQKRVAEAFKKVVCDVEKNGEERAFIVVHGGTIMAIMSSFAEEPKSYFDWFVKNCCGFCVVINEDTWMESQRFENFRYFERLST